jgi:hypothetical protein
MRRRKRGAVHSCRVVSTWGPGGRGAQGGRVVGEDRVLHCIVCVVYISLIALALGFREPATRPPRSS